jgi:hypothetical protein
MVARLRARTGYIGARKTGTRFPMAINARLVYFWLELMRRRFSAARQ